MTVNLLRCPKAMAVVVRGRNGKKSMKEGTDEPAASPFKGVLVETIAQFVVCLFSVLGASTWTAAVSTAHMPTQPPPEAVDT